MAELFTAPTLAVTRDPLGRVCMLASPTCTAAGAWVAPAITPGAGDVETFVAVDVVAHPNANSASIENKNNFFTFDLLLLERRYGRIFRLWKLYMEAESPGDVFFGPATS